MIQRSIKYSVVFYFSISILIPSNAQDTNDLYGSKPNIIHILADDLGYDDVGCYGSTDILTPNIDKLASNGVKFTDFYAPAPVCTPSRAAILTGKYSFKVKGCEGILFPHMNKGADPEKEILISRILKEEGYATALIGKWHMGSYPKYRPNNHGFDYHYGLLYCNDHGPERNPKHNYGWPEIPLYENGTIIEQPVDLVNVPDRMSEKLLQFIDKSKKGPFYIHFADFITHTPWYVPERFQLKCDIGRYGDAVQALDWYVGQIITKLTELDLLENTLIVFSSDNGPLYATTTEFIDCYGDFGRVNIEREHFLKGGKGLAEYEGGVRVPGIFSWKGVILENKVSTAYAGGIDLFTTFAYLAGVDVTTRDEIDGQNILPLLINPQEVTPHDTFLSFMGMYLRGLRKGDWKLSIDNLNYVRLYNVVEDPREKHDMAIAYPEKMFELLEIAEQKSQEMGFQLRYR